MSDMRVDVAGYSVIVKGEAARDHLEAVNRERAQMQLDNAHLRAELAALRAPVGDALVVEAARAIDIGLLDENFETFPDLARAVLAAVVPMVRAEALEAASRAVRVCPSLDMNSHICEKAAAIRAINQIGWTPPPEAAL